MIKQLDTENADLDLTSSVTVLTHTPSATLPVHCAGVVYLGDGAKNLDGTGGNFEIAITVGSQTLEPSPDVIACSTGVRTVLQTVQFWVPANEAVVIKVKSPNGADTDVDVTAYLYDLSPQILGTDYKNLVSTDAQDLSGTLDVNAKTIGTTAAASVNAEVVDVLAVDTVAEMAQGAPPATPTIEEMLNYIYRNWRNKTIQTGTGGSATLVVRDDGDASDLFKCDLTDAAGVLTKAEFVTG